MSLFYESIGPSNGEKKLHSADALARQYPKHVGRILGYKNIFGQDRQIINTFISGNIATINLSQHFASKDYRHINLYQCVNGCNHSPP